MNYLLAFLFSGFVCLIAQLIYDHSRLTTGQITSLFVLLCYFLYILNIFNNLISISFLKILLLNHLNSIINSCNSRIPLRYFP